MLLLRARRKRELAARTSTDEVESVDLGLRRPRVCQHQLAGRHLEMLHEVAADQIVVVAESRSGLPVGGEQETRVLNCMTSEDEAFCASVVYFAVEQSVAGSLPRG